MAMAISGHVFFCFLSAG